MLISLTTLEALSHAPSIYGAYMRIPNESGKRWAGYGHQTIYLWVKRIAELNAKLSNQLKERGTIHWPFGLTNVLKSPNSRKKRLYVCHVA